MLIKMIYTEPTYDSTTKDVIHQISEILIRLVSNTNLPSTLKKEKKVMKKNLLAGSMDLNCTV